MDKATKESRRSADLICNATSAAENLRNQIEESHRKDQLKEAELAQLKEELCRRTTALEQAHASLDEFQSKFETRESDLHRELADAIKAHRDVVAASEIA